MRRSSTPRCLRHLHGFGVSLPPVASVVDEGTPRGRSEMGPSPPAPLPEGEGSGSFLPARGEAKGPPGVELMVDLGVGPQTKRKGAEAVRGKGL